MPYRHEFAISFLNEAELHICGLRLDPTDSEDAFREAVSVLEAYNQVVEARAHITSEIERWRLHKVRATDEDVTAHLPPGSDQIVSLGPFLGKEGLEGLAQCIHEKEHLAAVSKRLEGDKKFGIQRAKESKICATLVDVAISGAWDEAGIARWNEAIDQARALAVEQQGGGGVMLSEREVRFCTDTGVDFEEYKAMKSAMLREYCARGKMNDLVLNRIAMGKEELCRQIYAFLVGEGWIA
jgi:hypothetical protein